MFSWNRKRFEEEEILRGARASVALSHDDGCECEICKNSRGEYLSLEGAAGESRVPSETEPTTGSLSLDKLLDFVEEREEESSA